MIETKVICLHIKVDKKIQKGILKILFLHNIWGYKKVMILRLPFINIDDISRVFNFFT